MRQERSDSTKCDKENIRLKQLLADFYFIPGLNFLHSIFGINTTEKTINEIQDIIRYVYKPIKTIKFHYPKKDYLEYLIKYEKYI